MDLTCSRCGRPQARAGSPGWNQTRLELCKSCGKTICYGCQKYVNNGTEFWRDCPCCGRAVDGNNRRSSQPPPGAPQSVIHKGPPNRAAAEELYVRAVNCMETGGLKADAIRWLKAAAEADDTFPDPWDKLHDVYFSMGRADEATAAIKKYAELSGIDKTMPAAKPASTPGKPTPAPSQSAKPPKLKAAPTNAQQANANPGCVRAFAILLLIGIVGGIPGGIYLWKDQVDQSNRPRRELAQRAEALVPGFTYADFTKELPRIRTSLQNKERFEPPFFGIERLYDPLGGSEGGWRTVPEGTDKLNDAKTILYLVWGGGEPEDWLTACFIDKTDPKRRRVVEVRLKSAGSSAPIQWDELLAKAYAEMRGHNTVDPR